MGKKTHYHQYIHKRKTNNGETNYIYHITINSRDDWAKLLRQHHVSICLVDVLIQAQRIFEEGQVCRHGNRLRVERNLRRFLKDPWHCSTIQPSQHYRYPSILRPDCRRRLWSGIPQG